MELFWYRNFVNLGRNNVVGSTVKTEQALPEHLTVDEKHVRFHGVKGYVATTGANGCMLGASLSLGVSEQELTEGYGEFASELKAVAPSFSPLTANCDGWSATQNAIKSLFKGITVVLCFLHSWLSIRDRCRKAKELTYSIGERVWRAYHSQTKRLFSQRIRRLREWAQKELDEGIVKQKVLKLCSKREEFTKA